MSKKSGTLIKIVAITAGVAAVGAACYIYKDKIKEFLEKPELKHKLDTTKNFVSDKTKNVKSFVNSKVLKKDEDFFEDDEFFDEISIDVTGDRSYTTINNEPEKITDFKLKETIHETAEKAKEGAEKAKQTIHEKTEDAKDKIAIKADDVISKVSERAESARAKEAAKAEEEAKKAAEAEAKAAEEAKEAAKEAVDAALEDAEDYENEGLSDSTEDEDSLSDLSKLDGV